MNDLAYQQRIAGELKLEPLIGLDPNNQGDLEALVAQAVLVAKKYTIDAANKEAIKLLALLINQWGADFEEQPWAKHILEDEQGDDLLKVQELQLYALFERAGPDSFDFPAYCILKFKRRIPTMDYENSDIRAAVDIGLSIAQDHNINDMLNTYSCVELVLLTAGNFTEKPVCAALKVAFKDPNKSADDKIAFSYDWLNHNIDAVYASI